MEDWKHARLSSRCCWRSFQYPASRALCRAQQILFLLSKTVAKRTPPPAKSLDLTEFTRRVDALCSRRSPDRARVLTVRSPLVWGALPRSTFGVGLTPALTLKIRIRQAWSLQRFFGEERRRSRPRVCPKDRKQSHLSRQAVQSLPLLGRLPHPKNFSESHGGSKAPGRDGSRSIRSECSEISRENRCQ